MASTDIYKEVDKLNKRIIRAEKAWGKESDVYRDYERALHKLLPSDALTESKKGVIQIKKGAGTLNKLDQGKLETVQTVTRTSTEYKRHTEREFKREYGSGKPTRTQLRDFSDKKTKVKDAAASGKLRLKYKEKGDAALSVMSQKSKTYEELWQIIKEDEEAEAGSNTEQEELVEFVQAALDEIPEDWR